MKFKDRYTLFFIICVAACLAFAGNAAAANPQSQVSGGDWGTPATWSGGLVPLAGDTVDIMNGFPVVVTGFARGLLVNAREDINVNAGGFLVPGTLSIGVVTASTVTVKDDGLVAPGIGVIVGPGSGPGGVYIHNGVAGSPTTAAPSFLIGDSSDPGEFELRGPNGVVSVTSMTIGANGTLRVTPTANGVSGLSSLFTSTLTLVAGNTLVLDDSLYAPQIGDSWTIASPTTTLGTFDNLVAPPGLALNVVGAKGGPAVVITVVAGAALPATSYWGWAILVSLLPVIGVFYVARRRRDAIAID